ncbi:hypothetical protein GCM10017782_12010 [Deinococcus ficus]|nr:hypothetical protein GCM10017782_12010 [Deinococcus ficus]
MGPEGAQRDPQGGEQGAGGGEIQEAAGHAGQGTGAVGEKGPGGGEVGEQGGASSPALPVYPKVVICCQERHERPFPPPENLPVWTLPRGHEWGKWEAGGGNWGEKWESVVNRGRACYTRCAA